MTLEAFSNPNTSMVLISNNLVITGSQMSTLLPQGCAVVWISHSRRMLDSGIVLWVHRKEMNNGRVDSRGDVSSCLMQLLSIPCHIAIEGM